MEEDKRIKVGDVLYSARQVKNKQPIISLENRDGREREWAQVLILDLGGTGKLFVTLQKEGGRGVSH